MATFEAMVTEHFCGLNVVNANHIMAPLIFFKAADAMLDILMNIPKEKWPSDIKGASSLHNFLSKLIFYLSRIGYRWRCTRRAIHTVPSSRVTTEDEECLA